MRLTLQVPSVLVLAFFATACRSSSSDSKDESSADSGTTRGDNRPCEASTLASGTFDLTHNGVAYPGYVVHVPPSYDGTKRTPLVVDWHGLTSNAAQQQFFSAMDPVSDENGFIVVYPNSPDKSWNAGTCCGGGGRDDAGFGVALVEEISKRACIDSKRVYSTGMSNGGFMSHRLGCEYADVFAAIAPVAGKVGLADCNPSRPVPVIHFHGTADTLVAYDTGALSGENRNVPDTLQGWADRNGCKKGPEQTKKQGATTCQTWSECDGGALVTLCTSEGEGHCWPGQSVCPYGAATLDIDASREMAAFFEKFVLP